MTNLTLKLNKLLKTTLVILIIDNVNNEKHHQLFTVVGDVLETFFHLVQTFKQPER